MVDVHTKKQRSYNMSKIKASQTKPELKLKRFLKLLEFTYQPKNIYGNPDFVNKKQKVAIFVDGCFWHKCPKHYIRPKQNVHFWKEKISANVKRDKKVTIELKRKGWKVIRIWECNIIKITV